MLSRGGSSPEVRTAGIRDQLRAGRLTRRLPQLVFGLVIAGVSIGLMVEAHLGLDPWNVLHEGLTHLLPVSFGVVTILSGLVVLLLWIPLRQPLGIGTVINIVVVGVVADLALWALPTPEPMGMRIAFLVGGVVLCGLGGAIYLGSHLGPGPRDGLMTGLVTRTRWSVRVVRTGLEATVLVLGFLLGGTVGVGTVLFAVAIGPLIQFFLPWAAAPFDEPPVSVGAECAD